MTRDGGRHRLPGPRAPVGTMTINLPGRWGL